MSIVDYSIEKIKLWHQQYQKEFKYDCYRKDGESEFEYLKKVCQIFKDKYGYITRREWLSIIAEIYYKKTLTEEEKEYLYINFLKRPEVEEKIFVRLTERELLVEHAKEIWANITV